MKKSSSSLEEKEDVGDVQSRIFTWVAQIPEGKVMNYGQIGDLITPPVGARQVGWIMYRSPEDLPWWRVVGADGSLRLQKRDPQAAWLQRHLLTKEGVSFHNDRVKMSIHRWEPSFPEVPP